MTLLASITRNAAARNGDRPVVITPAGWSLSFRDLESRLNNLENGIAYAKTYDDVVKLRAELGSRGKPSQLTRDMQEAGPTRRILSGPEFKAVGKIWARCDRQLAKLEEKLKPDAADSFTDPPEEEPPSPEDDGRP